MLFFWLNPTAVNNASESNGEHPGPRAHYNSFGDEDSSETSETIEQQIEKKIWDNRVCSVRCVCCVYVRWLMQFSFAYFFLQESVSWSEFASIFASILCSSPDIVDNLQYLLGMAEERSEA